MIRSFMKEDIQFNDLVMLNVEERVTCETTYCGNDVLHTGYYSIDERAYNGISIEDYVLILKSKGFEEF